MYVEIVAVSSEVHTKYIKVLYGPNVEFFIVKCAGRYNNHLDLKS